jgi:hypothetical protein
MIELLRSLICMFKPHEYDVVICSKDYKKALWVCNRCGKCWYHVSEDINYGRKDYLKLDELL